MEYLQYEVILDYNNVAEGVLNLIINGIPSIPMKVLMSMLNQQICFKPYYKWNTFNTKNFSGNEPQLNRF